MSVWIGIVCSLAFIGSFIYMIRRKNRLQKIELQGGKKKNTDTKENIETENIYLTTTAI